MYSLDGLKMTRYFCLFKVQFICFQIGLNIFLSLSDGEVVHDINSVKCVVLGELTSTPVQGNTFLVLSDCFCMTIRTTDVKGFPV